jgi:peptidoglycan/xylan/chitin deacetylase (PgdA/CDA1 family)
MARYVTFRFDDGLIAGARTAAKLLRPNHATFFIITGPIEGSIDLAGDYGDLEAWNCLATDENDIQPHSKSHLHFCRISPKAQEDEIRHSLEFVRKIHDGPYIFCYPYNHVPVFRPPVRELSASGFHTVDSPSDAGANLLTSGLDFFALQSLAVTQSSFHLILRHLESVPDNAWVVLGLHSLDGEDSSL